MSAELVWIGPELKKDLREVCEYLENSGEKKHYAESGYSKDHIWRKVKRVKKLLKNLR